MATDDRRPVGTSATATVVYRPLTTIRAIQPGIENSWTHHKSHDELTGAGAQPEQDPGPDRLSGQQEGDAGEAQPGQRPPAERRHRQAEEDAATETGRQPAPPSPLSPRFHR